MIHDAWLSVSYPTMQQPFVGVKWISVMDRLDVYIVKSALDNLYLMCSGELEIIFFWSIF